MHSFQMQWRKALNSTTDVTGGLVLTNVMMLRNAEGEVTAGMSGLKEDGVLLWGGGDYWDAINALDSDYVMNANGDEITTLIQKDGRAKIGIFKLDETRAVIDVPEQGKIYIDASTGDEAGIRIADASGKDRIKISPKSIVDEKPKQDTSNTMSESSSVAFEKITNHSGSKTYSAKSIKPVSQTTTTNGNQTTTTMIYNTLTSVACTATFNFNATRRAQIGHTLNETTTFTLTAYVSVNGVSVGTHTRTNSLTGSTTSGSFTETINLGASGLNISLGGSCQVSINWGVTPSATSAYVTASVSGRTISTSGVDGVVCSYQHKTTTSITYAYPEMAVLCRDGFLSLKNKNQYFMIDNTSEQQKISTKNLVTSATESGQLYVSSNFIDSFKSFLDVFYELCGKLRTINNNETNAVEVQGKINELKAKLVDTKLIATK